MTTRELRRLRRLLADGEGDAEPDLESRVAELESRVAEREWGLAVEGVAAGAVHPVTALEAK